MSVFTTNAAELKTKQQAAVTAAAHINTTFEKVGSLKKMIVEKFIMPTYAQKFHKALGHDGDMLTKIEQFYSQALRLTDEKMQKDANLRFLAGDKGSVWLDVEDITALGKTKKVRFYLAGSNECGFKYTLEMNAVYFDQKW